MGLGVLVMLITCIAGGELTSLFALLIHFTLPPGDERGQISFFRYEQSPGGAIYVIPFISATC